MDILQRKNISLWDLNKRKDTREQHRYKEVNDVWIGNGFNRRRNIGYCIELLKDCQPNTFEEWEKYYIQSGINARNKIDNLYYRMKHNKISYEEFRELRYNVKCNHGKDFNDLIDLAEKFQNALLEKEIDRSLEECFNYIYIKAIDESWIGYNRERQAVETLTSLCDERGCYIKESDTILDIKYCVDYEIYKKSTDELVCGVQVKGYEFLLANQQSYKSEALQTAIEITKDAHKKYLEEFGKQAAFLYIMKNGRCERESFKELKKLLPKQQLDKQLKTVKYNRQYNKEKIDKTLEKIR